MIMKKKNLIATIFGFCFSIGFGQVPVNIPTNGLVAWYSFSGNANDGSGNGNDGVVNGATSSNDRFGNSNQSYYFDGVNDNINCGANTDQSMLFNDLTISYWVKLDGLNDGMTIGSFDWGYYLGIGGGKAYYTYINSSMNWDICSDIDTVLINDWVNLTFTRDLNSTVVNLFVNGVLTASSNCVAPNIPNSQNNFFIGGNVIDNNNYFKGNIDDIGFWNRVLTQNEIFGIVDDVPCTTTIYDTVYVSVTDTLIINASLTGVAEPNNINTLKIFPNPAMTHITIDCGNFNSMTGYTLRVDNSLAQTVFTSTVSQQNYIVDLSTWTGNGTYFVYVVDSNTNIIDIKKIVLQ